MTDQLDFSDLDHLLLADIPDAPPTIPSGEYHTKIVDATVREAKNPGTDGQKSKYVNYRAVVQSGQYAGTSLFGMWNFTEKQLWRMKGDFKRLGFVPPGRTLADLAASIQDGALNGIEGVAKISEGVRVTNGQPDPDGVRENRIQKWLAAV